MADRVSLGLDDVDNKNEVSIGIEELVNHNTTPPTPSDVRTALEREGAKHGFVSRQPVIRPGRRRSPYTDQCNLKMRPGMRDVFQELSARMGFFDQETLEIALLALIEKEGFTDLEKAYNSILGVEKSKQ